MVEIDYWRRRKKTFHIFPQSLNNSTRPTECTFLQRPTFRASLLIKLVYEP